MKEWFAKLFRNFPSEIPVANSENSLYNGLTASNILAKSQAKDDDQMPGNQTSNQEKHHTKKQTWLSVICILLILGSLLFLGYYHLLQPYLSEQTTEEYRNLYHADNASLEAAGTDNTSLEAIDTDSSPTDNATADAEQQSDSADDHATLPANYPKFEALLQRNSNICGWLTLPETNIDYPVVSSAKEEADYYLTHNIDGEEDKNGTLFVDYRTPLSENAKVVVINGHNMQSTGLMFHELTAYNDLAFYQQDPTFRFDTLYGDAQWKIIALIKTNNNENHGERLNYFENTFDSDTAFLDFVYQLELRSIFHCPVTVNESDTLLILSTCTYEMNDMRFLVVARKVREEEDPFVDTALSYKKKTVLYPDAWYKQYGGKKPNVTSFSEAYEAGEIDWCDGTLF